MQFRGGPDGRGAQPGDPPRSCARSSRESSAATGTWFMTTSAGRPAAAAGASSAPPARPSTAVGYVDAGTGQRLGERAEPLLDLGQGRPAVGVALPELGVGGRRQLALDPGGRRAERLGELGVPVVETPWQR